MTDAGLIVSKPGYEASNDTDIQNLIMHSDHNSFKIIAEGEVEISVPASSGTYSETVNHGLSFTPAFNAFAELRGSSTVSYPPNSYDLFSGSGEGFYVDVDSTRLRMQVEGTGTAYTATVKYYIIGDPSL